MHRYVDFHYQYLTSSYACMLSCPISLGPFVILEGTGLGPWGAQGQTKGGVADVTSTHVGKALCLPPSKYKPQTNTRTRRGLLVCSVTGVQGWSGVWWRVVCCEYGMLSIMKTYLICLHRHIQLRIWTILKLFAVSLINQHLYKYTFRLIHLESHFECHCVGTSLF